MVLFSHLAALTTCISFVTSVLVLPQRQTAVVAKQVASIPGRVYRGPGWQAAIDQALELGFDDCSIGFDRLAQPGLSHPNISRQ